MQSLNEALTPESLIFAIEASKGRVRSKSLTRPVAAFPRRRVFYVPHGRSRGLHVVAVKPRLGRVGQNKGSLSFLFYAELACIDEFVSLSVPEAIGTLEALNRIGAGFNIAVVLHCPPS